MDVGLTPEQETVRAYARTVLEKECPTAFVRQALDHATAHDEDAYRRLADLGWAGMAIPERLGGAGLSLLDLAVVLQEMGRVGLPGPFFATVALAAPVIEGMGTIEQQQALLPDIASGNRLATVAFPGPHPRLDPADIAVRLTEDGDGLHLDGTAPLVPDAHVADTIVVPARTGAGVAVLLVDRGSPGVSVVPRTTLDRTRRWCDVVLDRAPVTEEALLGVPGDAWPALEQALLRSAALLCAEVAGTAERLLEMTVEHARTRVQFDRPIGSFQAVKHRCADMVLDVELSRSAVLYAAWAAAEAPDELELAVSTAKAYCSEAVVRVAKSAALVHGAIGFTWEHDLHLFLRRAYVNEVFLGGASHHHDRVARLLAG